MPRPIPTSATVLPLLLTAASATLATDRAPQQDRAPTQDSGGELDAERACYDVLRYDLQLAVDPEQRRIEGQNRIGAWLEFPSPRLRIDLDRRLEVRAVTLDGRAAQFERDGDRLYVDSSALGGGARFELTVAYGGAPREARRAPWDGGFVWSQTPSGAPWIATACQGEGADLWWPCKDHPSDEASSMGLSIEVPEPLVVASNGRLVRTESAEGRRTYHWEVSTPINNYGVALNIAPYLTLEHPYQSVTGESFPFLFWCLPESEERARAILPEFAAHMRQLEELCGPYPFRADKYGVVETPHLGMEHQSIIAYGNRFAGDPNFDYDWLHHHELAHEWWANLVTARDWSDFWIHEGVGTYVQALYLEQRFGVQAYREKLALDRRRIEHSGPLAPRGARSVGFMYTARRGAGSPGADIYFKGSWVCHELRWLLGDETFFRVLRRWAYPDPALEAVTDGRQCRLTDTDELLAIAEREAGRELGWYFEVAVRRAAPPELRATRTDGRLHLAWSAPDDLPFPMPVELAIGGERRRVDVPIDGVELEVGDAAVQIDPDDWLLGAD
jgi:aminopeptidase N